MEALKDVELDEEEKGKLEEKIEQELQSRLEEEISGLKLKNDELITEKRIVQEEREAARIEAKAVAEAKAKAKNDYRQLFESQQQETNTLRSTIDQMHSDITLSKIAAEAAKISSLLTKDASRAKLLQQQLSQRLTIVDDELRVSDEKGQLTVSSIEDLTNSIKKDYPFLIDGSQANGGGAVRAQGWAEARSKQMLRADFEALRPIEKSEFMRSGGKLTDSNE
jgi:hypothetical protein